MSEKIQRALTFRAALDQKLNVIAKAFGSNSEGARQIGVSDRIVRYWRTGRYPASKILPKVDEVYAMAVEILNDPELLRKRQETSKKIRSLSKKLNLSEATVKLLQAEGLY